MNVFKYYIVKGYVINKENGKIEELCEGYRISEEYKNNCDSVIFRDINCDIEKKLNIKFFDSECCWNKDEIIGSILYCYPSRKRGTLCKIVKIRYKECDELEYMVRVGCGDI